MEAISGDSLNREELERIPVTELQLVDAASNRLLAAIADITDILTDAEQRATLSDHDEPAVKRCGGLVFVRILIKPEIFDQR